MDELLDIVSDEDIVIGQESRSEVHRLGLQHRGVHVFLFTPDGKLLIQKRSANRDYPSSWDGSVSEHVKAGESYLDAALRGMREEMGVEGIEVRPLITFKLNYGPNDNEISRLYEGMIDPSRVSFDPLEIEEIDYYSMEKLTDIMASGQEKLCSWFIEILNWQLGRPTQISILKASQTSGSWVAGI